MRGKNVIRRDDYELYAIRLPLMMRSRQRRAYIAHELEKLHPLFSSRCCVDTSLALRRKGLVASVAVMDKVTLASYRSKSKGMLFLEGQGRRAVFSRNRIALYEALLLSFAVAAGVLGLSVHGEKPVASDAVVPAASVMTPEREPFAPVLCRALSALDEAGATTDSFSLADGRMSLRVLGVLPERAVPLLSELTALSLSDVVYADGVPSFTASWGYDPDVPADSELLSHQAELRALLSSCGADIVTESSLGGRMSFTVPKDMLGVLLLRLSSFCASSETDVAMLSFVTAADASQCSLAIAPAGDGSGSLHQALPLLSALLAGRRTESALEMPSRPREKSGAGGTRVQIGKITERDGRTLVFYSVDGKKIIGVYE